MIKDIVIEFFEVDKNWEKGLKVNICELFIMY